MGRRANKRPATDDLTGAAGVLDSGENLSQLNRKKKRVKKSKSSTEAPPGESSRQIDDAVEAVLSQSPPPSQMNADVDLDSSIDEMDGQQLKEAVVTLAGQVKTQHEIINKLTGQVDFLLSYLGISKPQVVTAAKTASTSLSGIAACLPVGSTSTSSAQVSGSVGAGGQASSSSSTTAAATVTYSAVTTQRPVPLSSALQQAVVSAVYRDFEDRDRRNRNIIVSGIPATVPNDAIAVQQLLEDQFGRTYTVTKCRRLGRPVPGKTRPVLATMSTVDEASFLVLNAKQLRQSKNDHIRSSVYINQDVTRAEAYAAYQNRCERRRRAAERPHDHPSSTSSSAAVAAVSVHPAPSASPTASAVGPLMSALASAAGAGSLSSSASLSAAPVQPTAPSNPPSAGLSTDAVSTAGGDNGQ